jgi:membrane-bound ClpP family serine protease
MEIFIPSGGLLGLLAVAALIASIVFAFRFGTTTGYIMLVVLFIFVPITIALGFKLFPHTPVGKRLILSSPKRNPKKAATPPPTIDDQNYAHLKGKTGLTLTPLRPSGIAEIDNERYSVVSEGDLIEKNSKIIVSKIEGNNIIVEPQQG